MDKTPVSYNSIAPIEEARYKADLELLDRYQGYSTELVRLSLLGIAALAFFITKIGSEAKFENVLQDDLAVFSFGFSALLFTMSIACALSHRYHSSDGFASHIKAVRLNSSEPIDVTAIGAATARRNGIYKVSGYWLAFAAGLFGAGGFLFFFALARLILIWIEGV